MTSLSEIVLQTGSAVAADILRLDLNFDLTLRNILATRVSSGLKQEDRTLGH